MQKGFTLIEVIVAVAVFLLISAVGVGIFVSVVETQRKILYRQELFNQMSYAKERMSKSLRMAIEDSDENFRCLRDDQGTYPGQNYLLTKRPGDIDYTGIKFLNASDERNGYPVCMEFYWDRGTGLIMQKEMLYPYNPDASAVPLTSSRIFVESIKFALDGCYGPACPKSDKQDSFYAVLQPRVTFMIKAGIAGIDNSSVVFQTTVSQRNLNAK